MEPLHHLIMKANAAFSRKILAGAAQMGLTPGQPKVLEFLRMVPEADQKTIASRCEIEPATVGSILLRMERSGLVVRQQHQGNRRSLFVSLTPLGRETAEKMALVFQAADEQAARSLTPEEQQTLCALLERVCDGLSSSASPSQTQERQDR